MGTTEKLTCGVRGLPRGFYEHMEAFTKQVGDLVFRLDSSLVLQHQTVGLQQQTIERLDQTIARFDQTIARFDQAQVRQDAMNKHILELIDQGRRSQARQEQGSKELLNETDQNISSANRAIIRTAETLSI
mmetsp:Transcript_4527/g.8693  ORF Transcript_4527/g.8693 Transcript_4527/m.8693 type:complete len:131 (-) Transcript_4527:97-489(-)